MEKKFVEYNGTQVIEGWPERIEPNPALNTGAAR